MTTSLARKYVADELVQWHTALFEPVHGASDVDFAVRTGDGQYVEIIVREPSSPDKPRSFVMKRFRPRSHLFIIALAHGPEAWILPSIVFERFAAGAPGEKEWNLNLDTPPDEPLSERLSVYRERWAIIAHYAEYRSTLSDPLALQVRIAME